VVEAQRCHGLAALTSRIVIDRTPPARDRRAPSKPRRYHRADQHPRRVQRGCVGNEATAARDECGGFVLTPDRTPLLTDQPLGGAGSDSGPDERTDAVRDGHRDSAPCGDARGCTKLVGAAEARTGHPESDEGEERNNDSHQGPHRTAGERRSEQWQDRAGRERQGRGAPATRPATPAVMTAVRPAP
jgi:hypothetical protein